MYFRCTAFSFTCIFGIDCEVNTRPGKWRNAWGQRDIVISARNRPTARAENWSTVQLLTACYILKITLCLNSGLWELSIGYENKNVTVIYTSLDPERHEEDLIMTLDDEVLNETLKTYKESSKFKKFWNLLECLMWCLIICNTREHSYHLSVMREKIVTHDVSASGKWMCKYTKPSNHEAPWRGITAWLWYN